MRANQIIWQEVESWTVGSVSGKICRQDNWNCLRIISSVEREERIQDNSSQARRKRKRGVRERKWNKGKEYGCRPVSEWVKNGQAAFSYQLWTEVMTAPSWLVVEPIALNHISTLLEILLFLLFVQFQSFSFPLYCTRFYIVLPTATPRLVYTICSCLVKHYSFPV